LICCMDCHTDSWILLWSLVRLFSARIFTIFLNLDDCYEGARICMRRIEEALNSK
jgi:hypothetical protein